LSNVKPLATDDGDVVGKLVKKGPCKIKEEQVKNVKRAAGE
jgi:hypothetical protein